MNAILPIFLTLAGLALLGALVMFVFSAISGGMPADDYDWED